MKKLFTVLLLLFSLAIFSQEKFIQITNSTHTKTVTIKEHKRIRIKTKEGKKITGKFSILNSKSILIKNKRIQIADIIKIKRNPIGLAIPVSALMVYSGVLSIGFSGIIAIVAREPTALLLIPAGGGLIYGGIVFPNPLKGYKKAKNWHYKIIY